jgi:hypothetical protein
MVLYNTAAPFFGAPPDWLNATDARRLAAYEFYKALYKNDNTTYKVDLRGDEENPLYVPAAKRIVKTMARYVCKGLGFTPVIDPLFTVADDQQAAMITAYGNLFKREEFFANFRDALEMGIAQGDFCLYVSGDVAKPEGSRITLRFIDPGTYFPMTDPMDAQRVVGQQMVERVFLNASLQARMPDSTTEYLRRQRWLKVTSPLHPGYVEPPGVPNYETPIQYESVIMNTRDWEDPAKAEIVRVDFPLAELPGITQLPIYHFVNKGETGELMGVSELEGFERLVMGVNQAITDEDVALAMQGLGMYVTDQVPVNADGERTDWVLGPRRVVEVSANGTFTRVGGVEKITAYQDHIGYLQDQAESTAGISDVALGQVDTSVADSGIALALRFGPLLDEAERKDDRVIPKLNQFSYDLRQWFAVYEGTQFPDGLTIEFEAGDKLPQDRDKLLATYQDLFVNGVLTMRLYIEKLNELGFNLGDPAKLIAEQEADAQKSLERQQAMMAADPTAEDGNRLDAEAEAPDDAEV